MSQLSPILRDVEGNGLMFRCPGCDQAHIVYVSIQIVVPGYTDSNGDWVPERISQPAPAPSRPSWGWNGDIHKPTFTPSVLVRGIRQDMTEAEHAAYDLAYEKCGFTSAILNDPRFASVCHSFVIDGRIQFLGDCTHALAGQTVDLPPWKSSP